jgi:hypothetical protein
LSGFTAAPCTTAFAMAAGDFGHGHELAAMRVENEAMSGQVHGRKCSRIVLYMRRNAFEVLGVARADPQ